MTFSKHSPATSSTSHLVGRTSLSNTFSMECFEPGKALMRQGPCQGGEKAFPNAQNRTQHVFLWGCSLGRRDFEYSAGFMPPLNTVSVHPDSSPDAPSSDSAGTQEQVPWDIDTEAEVEPQSSSNLLYLLIVWRRVLHCYGHEAV